VGNIIPFPELTPDKCANVADVAMEALHTMQRWGLTASPQSELASAERHLRIVARDGVFGRLPDEFQSTMLALEIAVDWARIASCLTEEPVSQIAKELMEALKRGAVGRRPTDVRSQFWFGAVLALAGLRPGVPPDNGRRPDFVIHADGMPLAVEVKRPESTKSAMAALKTGAGQIRDYGRPGFIALDLSAALQASRWARLPFKTPASAIDQFKTRFTGSAREISERVRGYRSTDKWSGLLGLFSYSRLHTWHHSEYIVPVSFLFLEAPIFERACSGIIEPTAQRVKHALLGALGSFDPTRQMRLLD
jgi:hypothetical protein